jgi:hypothetical protein
MLRTILVPLTATLSAETVLDAALALAKRVNANIRAMFISPNPHSALAYLPDVVLAAGLTREKIAGVRPGAALLRRCGLRQWTSDAGGQ